MKQINTIVLLAILIATALSCEKDEDLPPESNLQEKEVVLSRKTNYGEDWVYYSFASGAEVPEINDTNYQNSSEWDIAFNRYNVRTNGGSSGNGQASAYDAGAISFETVVEAPETGYTEDSSIEIVETLETTPPTMMDSNGNTIFIDAITFSGPPPTYTPNNHVYVIKTHDGKYAKLMITGFYNESGDSGYVNFKYKYQDDSSRKLE